MRHCWQQWMTISETYVRVVRTCLVSHCNIVRILYCWISSLFLCIGTVSTIFYIYFLLSFISSLTSCLIFVLDYVFTHIFIHLFFTLFIIYLLGVFSSRFFSFSRSILHGGLSGWEILSWLFSSLSLLPFLISVSQLILFKVTILYYYNN